MSKADIERIIDDAPFMAPSLINEIYEVLDEGGAEAVNILFETQGTFNPHFEDRQAAIRFIVTVKQLSGIMLTQEEKALYEQIEKSGKKKNR